MDAQVKTKKRTRLIVGLVILVALALMVAKYLSGAAERRREEEAIATAQGFATIIRESLGDKTELIVQSAEGKVKVRAVNEGTIFRTSQTSVVPYTAQYSVNLARTGLSDIRYDEATKTMFVEIPDVTISAPNIDETGKVIVERTGPWTSRDAAEKLAARSSKLAVASATTSVNQPEKVEKARANAKIMVDRLLELPLHASGRQDVNVVVRYRGEAGPQSERWDVSPSIEQVLARRNER